MDATHAMCPKWRTVLKVTLKTFLGHSFVLVTRIDLKLVPGRPCDGPGQGF